MIEQKMANKTRIIGYTIGIVVFAVVALWKFVIR